MSKTKDVRSLQRTLAVLEQINLNNGASLNKVIKHTGLPKTTAYRLLENLRFAGYVRKLPETDGYWLTTKVLRLSAGFESERWIKDVVQPVLNRLTEKIAYPTAFSTLFGTSMIVRANTDAAADLVLDRYVPGTPVPLLQSASGLVFLAFSTQANREAVLQVCSKTDDPRLRLAKQKTALAQKLERIKAQGYEVSLRQRTKELGKSSTIAVPVKSRERLLGALAVRFIDKAFSRDEAVDAFFGPCTQSAREIVRLLRGSRR